MQKIDVCGNRIINQIMFVSCRDYGLTPCQIPFTSISDCWWCWLTFHDNTFYPVKASDHDLSDFLIIQRIWLARKWTRGVWRMPDVTWRVRPICWYWYDGKYSVCRYKLTQIIPILSRGGTDIDASFLGWISFQNYIMQHHTYTHKRGERCAIGYVS